MMAARSFSDVLLEEVGSMLWVLWVEMGEDFSGSEGVAMFLDGSQARRRFARE